MQTITATRPDVYFVGAPKVGTSALGMFLAQHPEVCSSRPKEPNFHNRDFDMSRPRTEEECLAHFPVSTRTKVICDNSILYLYSREAAPSIARYADNPRFLILLRNPVDAMYSWYGQMRYTSNEPIADFRRALDAEPERGKGRMLPPAGTGRSCPQLLCYRDVMRYHEQIGRHFDLFDRDRFLILIHDDLVRDTPGTYRAVLEFLGVDPSFAPEFRHVNPSKVRRYQALHVTLKRLFARPARALLPLHVRGRMIGIVDRYTSQEQKRQPLDPDLEVELREECRPDVDALGDLLGRDLSYWCRVD